MYFVTELQNVEKYLKMDIFGPYLVNDFSYSGNIHLRTYVGLLSGQEENLCRCKCHTNYESPYNYIFINYDQIKIFFHFILSFIIILQYHKETNCFTLTKSVQFVKKKNTLENKILYNILF